MFNIQELETIRRLQLPIKFFVMNNDGYSSIRASQKAYFGEAKLGSTKAMADVPNLTQVQRPLIEFDCDQESGDLRVEIAGSGHERTVVCDVMCCRMSCARLVYSPTKSQMAHSFRSPWRICFHFFRARSFWLT